MVKRERIERIEILVEPISYAPVAVDHLATARRWLAAAQRATQDAVDERARSALSPTSDVSVTRLGAGTTFRRLVDVPGAHLASALANWWATESHDDGHLRLDQLAPRDGLFELDGSLRRTRASRQVPIKLRLSPYLEDWCLLELVPQRTTRPSRPYFRTGHDALDRFVAALRRRDWEGSSAGTHRARSR